MKFSPPISNLLTRFSIVGEFSGGYSQINSNFNFNINVKVSVEIYVNSSINFSVSHLLKYLLALRIVKLQGTSKITAQFEAIPQCLLFFLVILLFIFKKQAQHEAYIFFNCFSLSLLTHRFVFPSKYILSIKSLQSNSIFLH